MKIILIGFMGSGKTSVAKKLGHHFNVPILEMDDLVLKKTNKRNMHEVFAKGGETLLRETEIAIAKEYASCEKCIVSTGGGAVMNPIILENLRKNGIVIYLKASFESITKRLADDAERPLFKNKAEAESLYHLRQPLYAKHADITIDVDTKAVEDIAREIAEMSLRS